ncbi:MAG: class II fructose-bisphosphate aldolase [Roseiflexaceae bacterium]
MLHPTLALLRAAQLGGYALGAFNVYNLEGACAVVAAAEAARSPAMLQVHPSALQFGGAPLIALCLAAARDAAVPIAVHLDHSSSPDAIRQALDAGVASIMADGSHLEYAANIAFTRAMAELAHARGAAIEAELGRLSGAEDGLTVEEYAAKLTDPAQATDFVERTGPDMLAVCIGNVHGRYSGEPRLDFQRLAAIRQAVPVPLVLHGASGLTPAQISQVIALGVRKLNVNTEVREAYLEALKQALDAPKPPDLIDLMRGMVAAMQAVVAEKLRLFGSVGTV